MSRRYHQHRRFKPKPYDAPRAEQSPAQVAATRRNFKVFNLRGLHALCHHLTGMRRMVAHMCIDAELARLGADSMDAHQAKGLAALEAHWAASDLAEKRRDFLERLRARRRFMRDMADGDDLDRLIPF